jgi:hypothetical protein
MPHSDERVREAISLRFDGYKWDYIARKLKYSSRGAVCTSVLRKLRTLLRDAQPAKVRVCTDLQEKNRQAYKLRFTNKLPYEEIAFQLCLDSPGQAKNCVDTWRRRLRNTA